MISLELKKEIFIRRFIKFQSYRSISKDLNINRGTVTKVSEDIIKKIKEIGLKDEVDLIKYIDKLVTEPKYERQRKSHKVNPSTKRLIKSMVESNEIKRTRNCGNVKTITELYTEFQTKRKSDKDGNNIYATNITYNHFYKLVTKIKKELLDKKIQNMKN